MLRNSKIRVNFLQILLFSQVAINNTICSNSNENSFKKNAKERHSTTVLILLNCTLCNPGFTDMHFRVCTVIINCLKKESVMCLVSIMF